MDALLIDQLQDIRRRARELVAGLSPEQITRRPDPRRWSIAECLAHLNAMGASYVPLIDAAIRRGRDGKIFGKGPFKPGPLCELLKWIAEPPPKFRLRAPKNLLPSSAITDPSRVIDEFMRLQDEWERLVRQSDGLDLEKVKVDSPLPILPRLRLAAPVQWMLAHERRHLLQAEKVRAEIHARAASA